MFPQLSSTVHLEEEVLSFWKGKEIFRKSLEKTRNKPGFTFYEGPPTANGTPHNGHVLTRAIKDLIPRYKTMRGYHVPRKGGWDTHGLPVEVEVQKQINLPGPHEILEFGLERFNKACMRSVFSYVNEWERLTEQIGFWLDIRDAYATFHEYYLESVWWALSELFRKGLLYQGLKVVWWWPQGQTALSAGEVGLGYKTVEDPSVTVRFQVRGRERTYFLAWTTTPWTLPSNVALAVRRDAHYAWVKVGDETLIIAEHLAGSLGGEVLKIVPGSKLVGMRYQPVYSFAAPEEGESFLVIAADFVTLDTGTGIVHQAPAFGEDDFLAARQAGLGILCLVGPDGRFVEGTGFLEGKFCKDTDKEIVRDLRKRGLLWKEERLKHEYPFCWRSDKDPLIQYARPAWFIRTTAKNTEVLRNNAAVNWLPKHIKDGRFGDFLRNNVDWALSRERFWGTPLNIWVCQNCGHKVAPSSAIEIESMSPGSLNRDVEPNLRLHRPWIDKVVLPCRHCGSEMHRVPEVIDCWFDAGCMPFAQWGWPHKNHETFKASFPADFISEAVDQTRGWFYALLMISTLLFDEETCSRYDLEPTYPHSYRNCVVLGHVCDAEGRKESKSRGNYVPPELIIRGRTRFFVRSNPKLEPGTLGMMQAQVRSLDLAPGGQIRLSSTENGEKHSFMVLKDKISEKETVHLNPGDMERMGLNGHVWIHAPFDPPGADAFRWLFYSASPPWTNTRLSLRAIREGQREFLLRLRNVYQFFAIYANIADFRPGSRSGRPAGERGLLDRWILHELTVLQQTVISQMDQYHLYEAARAIQGFIESLSNWYVRRSRVRFWGEGQDLDDALQTLHHVLHELTLLIAPFVPFTAEAMYQGLKEGRGSTDVELPESVHLCAYPEPDTSLLDPELAAGMALVRELARLGLAARAQVKVRVRQPLAAAEVVLANPELVESIRPLVPLLEAELNVRQVRFARKVEEFVSFKVKPNYRVLGKRLGKDMKACARAMARIPGERIRRRVMSGGLPLELPGGKVVLGEADVIVELVPREDFQAAGSPVAVVALHSRLDQDLLEEGMAREVVNRVQNLRKKLELGYTDRIRLGVGGDEAMVSAVKRFREYVAGETLALEIGEPTGQVHEVKADDRELLLSIQRIG